MIKIGDIVFVQTKGICELKGIEKNAFEGCDKNKEYYILKPVETSSNMVIYFPTDTKVSIRKLSSKQAVDKILKNIKDFPEIDVKTEEDRLKIYGETVSKGELSSWMSLLKTLAKRKKTISKKQFSFQEQRYFNIMLACVVDEISYIISKSKDEVKSMILDEFELSDEK